MTCRNVCIFAGRVVPEGPDCVPRIVQLLIPRCVQLDDEAQERNDIVSSAEAYR